MALAMATASGKGIPGCALPVSSTLDFCMEWNAENELKRVLKNGSEVARYAYDPVGRRIEKVAGPRTAAYLYDGQTIVRDASNGVATTYVHGPGVDEPMAGEDGSGLVYYHADGLGSVVKQTTSAGATLMVREYDAFGNLQVGEGTSGFAFTSHEWEPEIQAYYYRARYYSPREGRFIAEDPVFVEGWKNFYAYVDNDPVNWIDSSGESKGGKQNISVTDHRTGQTLTKRSPLRVIEQCLEDALEKRMSPQHIAKLRGLAKVVGRGGAMAISSPYIIDTTLSEIDRVKRCGGFSCLQKQLCDDLKEEGNPDLIFPACQHR